MRLLAAKKGKGRSGTEGWLTLVRLSPDGVAGKRDIGAFGGFSAELDPSSPSLADTLLYPSRGDCGLALLFPFLFSAASSSISSSRVAERIRGNLVIRGLLIRLPHSGNGASAAADDVDGFPSASLPGSGWLPRRKLRRTVAARRGSKKASTLAKERMKRKSEREVGGGLAKEWGERWEALTKEKTGVKAYDIPASAKECGSTDIEPRWPAGEEHASPSHEGIPCRSEEKMEGLNSRPQRASPRSTHRGKLYTCSTREAYARYPSHEGEATARLSSAAPPSSSIPCCPIGGRITPRRYVPVRFPNDVCVHLLADEAWSRTPTKFLISASSTRERRIRIVEGERRRISKFSVLFFLFFLLPPLICPTAGGDGRNRSLPTNFEQLRGENSPDRWYYPGVGSPGSPFSSLSSSFFLGWHHSTAGGDGRNRLLSAIFERLRDENRPNRWYLLIRAVPIGIADLGINNASCAK
ncbi:hypothetical protein B296_00003440 [Ensete ventricosum]|uniref:Uncharacterized protein n=1 Tax=Ensete ventricosum TaxID=4639 RepID=A0A427AZI5_ENSVE|nr:hypothetical protein B296_00003440 [Ensete ventricosum]